MRRAFRLSLLGALCAALTACASGSVIAPVNEGAVGRPNQPSGLVLPGDTLYSVAWRYGHDYRDLAQWNALGPPYRIRPGQRLSLGPTGLQPSVPRPAAAASIWPVKPDPSNQEAPVRVAANAAPPVAVSKTRKTRRAASSGSAAGSAAVHWHWPLQGAVVRRFDPREAGGKGIDIRPQGEQPVRAAASGKIVYGGSGLPGYGRLIIVKHSGSLLSAYGYLGKPLVHEGDGVEAGQILADTGSGGGYRGHVLHFEIRRDGKPVDPLRYLPG